VRIGVEGRADRLTKYIVAVQFSTNHPQVGAAEMTTIEEGAQSGGIRRDRALTANSAHVVNGCFKSRAQVALVDNAVGTSCRTNGVHRFDGTAGDWGYLTRTPVRAGVEG
jgi:hypothetical protein